MRRYICAFLAVILLLWPVATRHATVQSADGDAVSVQSMRLTATYNSIGVEVKFSGDNNGNSTAEVYYRRAGSDAWLRALPLWRTAASSGSAFYGSVVLLEPGTGYQVKVDIADPDGVLGTDPLVDSVTTRPDNVRPASELSPSYFVRADGNDANDGRSRSTAWRTLSKAFASAPAGAVVEVGPGTYPTPSLTRSQPITLVAQYPAVDDSGQPINAGQRTVISAQAVASPAGSAGPWQSAPWKEVSLTGPVTGKTFKVWKWAGAPVSGADYLAIAQRPGDVPFLVAYWSKKSGTYNGYSMSTPEGWAEVLYQNLSYNYGFTSFGDDVYLRLPGDANPNNYWAWLGTTTLTFSGPDIRLSGFELRIPEVKFFTDAARNGVFDHNLVLGGRLRYQGEQGTPSQYPQDHTVQYNRFEVKGLWGQNAVPWNFIKGGLKMPFGSAWGRVGEVMEITAIWGRGGAQRLVVRHNVIDGYFNGVGDYNADYDRYGMQDTDIHDNLLRHISDDAFEPEQSVINWRIWNNRVEYTSVALSTGPVNYGPIYLFRNQVWQLGNDGVGADNSGSKGVGVTGFKYSGEDSVPSRVWVVNNTFWTNRPDANGGAQFAGGGSSPERFWLRNNIFRTTRYAWSAPCLSAWNEDYDHFATTDTSRGVAFCGTRYTTNLSAYRSATGADHTNAAGNFVTASVVDDALVDPSAGDLALRQGAPFIDAGVVVPNITERYSGDAPDLGAVEYGSGGDAPPVPSPTPTQEPSPSPTATPTPTSSPTPSPDGSRTMPAGSVSIEGGAQYTSSPTVSVALADTGAAVVRLSNSPETSGGVLVAGKTVSYAPTVTWSLVDSAYGGASGDGVHKVYAQWGDGNGHWSSVASDDILLDTTSPSGSVTIAPDGTSDGADYVNSRSVKLAISASDPSPASGVKLMRFSNDGSSWSSWEPYSSTKSWTLSSKNGTKTVYAQFRDAAGNVSASARDSVMLDTSAPKVRGHVGALFTGTRVRLNTTTAQTRYSVTGKLSVVFQDDASGVAHFSVARKVGRGPYVTLSQARVRGLKIPLVLSDRLALVPGKTYRFRVIVRDRAGNTTTKYLGPITCTAFQESSWRVGIRGSSEINRDRRAYALRLKNVRSEGAGIRFVFSGRKVAWVATRGPNYGAARVFLDGAQVGRVNLRSERAARRYIVFARSVTPGRQHVLEVRPLPGRTLRANVDAFVVYR